MAVLEMRWLVPVAILGGLLAVGPGCSQCGRQIVFDLAITDPASQPIAGASATASCEDLAGPPLDGAASADGGGHLTFRVTAPNRACPDNAQKIGSYVRSCIVEVTAPGFRPATRMLTGAEMDLLTPAARFEDGNHVPLQFSLSRQ